MEPRAPEPSPTGAGMSEPAHAPGDGPPRARPPERRRRGVVRVTSAAAVALGLVVAGGSVAYASTSGNPTPGHPTPGHPAPGSGGTRLRPAAVGSVKSVGTSSFVLTTPSGTDMTVDVTAQTTYRDPKVTSPSFSDVTPGARVAVLGTTRTSQVTATTVMVGLPPRPGPGGPHTVPGGPA